MSLFICSVCRCEFDTQKEFEAHLDANRCCDVHQAEYFADGGWKA